MIAYRKLFTSDALDKLMRDYYRMKDLYLDYAYASMLSMQEAAQLKARINEIKREIVPKLDAKAALAIVREAAGLQTQE